MFSKYPICGDLFKFQSAESRNGRFRLEKRHYFPYGCFGLLDKRSLHTRQFPRRRNPHSFFHFYPLSPIIFHFHSASPSPSPGQPGYFLPFAGGDPQARGGGGGFVRAGGPFGPPALIKLARPLAAGRRTGRRALRARRRPPRPGRTATSLPRKPNPGPDAASRRKRPSHRRPVAAGGKGPVQQAQRPPGGPPPAGEHGCQRRGPGSDRVPR